jgi:hypothetical protein
MEVMPGRARAAGAEVLLRGYMIVPRIGLPSLMASAALISLAMTGAARAQVNEPPPSGAILDLNGQPISSTAVQYSVSFTATQSSTDISFAFRDDPGFLYFSNIAVVDSLAPNNNLLTNGDFSGGVYSENNNTAVPVGWTYENQYNATYQGEVENGVWVDGSVQAYDALSQLITTVIGDSYTISFFLSEDNGQGVTTYSDISTNGGSGSSGNGIDVLTYASASFDINQVPEPASFLVLGAGLLGVAAARRSQTRGRCSASAA